MGKTVLTSGLLLIGTVLGIFALAGEAAQKVSIAPTNAAAEPNQVVELRKRIMEGPYGIQPISKVVDAVILTEGPRLLDAYLAAALRKEEALGEITRRLRDAPPAAKRKLTKLIRYTGFAETAPTLVEILTSDDEHQLSRIGSLYALGAIGNKSVGPTIAKLLDSKSRGPTEKRIMIAVLARLNYRKAIPQIREYVDHNNPLVRIFAVRALADLEEKPPTEFLFESLNSKDFVIRQAACGALGSCGGPEAMMRLGELAQTDRIESVRGEARAGLLRLEAAGMNEVDRIEFLSSLIGRPEKKVRAWAVHSLAVECGESGRERLLRAVRVEQRERTRIAFYLLILPNAGADFKGGF